MSSQFQEPPLHPDLCECEQQGPPQLLSEPPVLCDLGRDPGRTAARFSGAPEHSVSCPVPFNKPLYCLNELVLASVACPDPGATSGTITVLAREPSKRTFQNGAAGRTEPIRAQRIRISLLRCWTLAS